MRPVKSESPYPGHNHHRQPELDQDEICSEESVARDHAPDEPDEVVLLVDDPTKGDQVLSAPVYSNRRRCHSFISFQHLRQTSVCRDLAILRLNESSDKLKFAGRILVRFLARIQ